MHVYVAKRRVLAAARSGQLLTCNTGKVGRRRVPAELLRHICLSENDVDPRGLLLHGAHIEGILDLRNTQVEHALGFWDCTFDDVIDIRGANLRQLAIAGSSRMPALLANNTRLQGDLDLGGTRVETVVPTSSSVSTQAAIWLTEAHIAGRMIMSGTNIDAGSQRAVQADRLTTGGTVRFIDGFVCHGAIRLIGARIAGSLDFTSARLCAPDVALDLGEAYVGGSLFFIDEPRRAQPGPRINGRVDLGNAEIRGRIMIRKAQFIRPTHDSSLHSHIQQGGIRNVAISAPRLRVDGDVTVHDSQVSGVLDLRSASIGGDFELARGRLENATETALNLAGSRLGALFSMAGPMEIAGSIYAPGLEVFGAVEWSDLSMTCPHWESSSSIILNHSRIRAPLHLKGIRADGATRCQNVYVGGDLRVKDGEYGGIVLDGSEVAQTIRVQQAKCRPAAGSDVAASMRQCRAHNGIHLSWSDVVGSIDLSSASTEELTVDLATWPANYSLAGLRFSTLVSLRNGLKEGTGVKELVRWIGGQRPFDASPYEQLAAVYAAQGRGTDAEQVRMLAGRESRRKDPALERSFTGIFKRSGDALFDFAVGYGYRPGRLLVALTIVIASVAVAVAVPPGSRLMRASSASGQVYTPSTVVIAGAPVSCSGGQVRCWNPFLFSLDTVVPLVDLGQRQTWYPDAKLRLGHIYQFGLAVATILGWLLSTVLVLALARFGRRAG
jgi:hypothetical protein